MALSLIRRRGELPLIDAETHELAVTVRVLTRFALIVKGKEIAFHPLVADDLAPEIVQRAKGLGIEVSRDEKLNPQEAEIRNAGKLMARVIGVRVDDAKLEQWFQQKSHGPRTES